MAKIQNTDSSKWNNRNSHSLLVGMQNSTVTVEDSLAISYKIKSTLNYTIQQSFTLVFT
jgi:hypothetical protein